MPTRSQRHLVEQRGYSSGGQPFSEGGFSPTLKQPTVGSINPTTGVHGAADMVVTITGTNFTPQTQVVLDPLSAPSGGAQATTYISATQVSFVMKLTNYTGAKAVGVWTRTGSFLSPAGIVYNVT